MQDPLPRSGGTRDAYQQETSRQAFNIRGSVEDGSRPGKAAPVPTGDMQHHLKTRCGAVVYSCEVSGLEAAYERKKAKYADLVTECRESGWSVRLCPVEVRARGFVGRSASCLIKDMGLRGATLSISTKELSEEAEKASHWLWLKRQDTAWGVTSN